MRGHTLVRLVLFGSILILGLPSLVPDLGAQQKTPRAATPAPAAPTVVVAYSDATLGAGTRLSAAFNSNNLKLVGVRYLAKQEWDVGLPSAYTACQPVPCNQPTPACPSPVSEVGMDCAKTETLADGTTVVSVNTQPAVANRHYRARIELTLK
jgi:hypothetical protein